MGRHGYPWRVRRGVVDGGGWPWVVLLGVAAAVPLAGGYQVTLYAAWRRYSRSRCSSDACNEPFEPTDRPGASSRGHLALATPSVLPTVLWSAETVDGRPSPACR